MGFMQAYRQDFVALVEAEKDGRLIFLHTGADW